MSNHTLAERILQIATVIYGGPTYSLNAARTIMTVRPFASGGMETRNDLFVLYLESIGVNFIHREEKGFEICAMLDTAVQEDLSAQLSRLKYSQLPLICSGIQHRLRDHRASLDRAEEGDITCVMLNAVIGNALLTNDLKPPAG